MRKKAIKTEELEKYSPTSISNAKLTTPLEAKDVSAFLECYENILRELEFPGFKNITYSETNIDFVLSNKNRSDFGKGYRAVLYAVFLLALMRYCIENDMPHPGFVILDSPLTTFKDRDREGLLGEDIPEDFKKKFFDYFSKNLNGQLIILDNEEPSEETKQRINNYQFTGLEGLGREGFF